MNMMLWDEKIQNPQSLNNIRLNISIFRITKLNKVPAQKSLSVIDPMHLHNKAGLLFATMSEKDLFQTS